MASLSPVLQWITTNRDTFRFEEPQGRGTENSGEGTCLVDDGIGESSLLPPFQQKTIAASNGQRRNLYTAKE